MWKIQIEALEDESLKYANVDYTDIHNTRIITYLYTVYIYTHLINLSFLAERWMRRTKITKKLRGSWRLPLQQDPRAALFGTRGGQAASTKQTWYTNVYRVCTVSGWIMLNRFLQPIEERKQEETLEALHDRSAAKSAFCPLLACRQHRSSLTSRRL